MFALLPAFGLANAGATLVGQNLGAAKPARSEEAVWIALRYNMIFLGVVGVLFVLFSGSIVGLFTTDPEVLANAYSRPIAVRRMGPFHPHRRDAAICPSVRLICH